MSIKEELFDNNYHADPYINPQRDCDMSILVCCRMSRGVGGPCDILTFLSSIVQYFRPYTQEKLEILIKFDIDDQLAINEFFSKSHLRERFPTLNIRQFVYGRWEGKPTFNYHYNFLFSHKNPKSKFVMFCTDDSFFYYDIFEESITPYFSSSHDMYKDYSIFTIRPNTELTNQPCNPLNSIGDYKKEWKKWSTGDLTEPFPIVSSKIIEICGGMGWQTNVDNWLALLNVILYKKYNVNLYRSMRKDYIRRITDERPGLENLSPSKFNHELLVTDSKISDLDYYFKLVETQADSIYLHMRKDGIL